MTTRSGISSKMIPEIKASVMKNTSHPDEPAVDEVGNYERG